MQVLQGNRLDGGLGLIDIVAKQKALKIQWIFKIQKDPIIESLANYFLNNKIGNLLWEANLSKDDIQLVVGRRGNFWTEVLSHWCDYNYEKLSEDMEVGSQVIWNNTHIRIENKPVILNQWIHKQIIRINDIIDDQGELMELIQLNEKYEINIFFTDYLGIKEAIPRWWVHSVDGKTDELVQSNFQK